MKILVCIKQVPDTTDIKWTENNTIQREGVESVINPFDVFAIEEALKIKRIFNDVEITVLTMGPAQASTILKKAISMGCDNGVLISDKKFAGADTYATGKTLSSAIKTQMSDFDLIFCGQFAVDGDTAQTGPSIASQLGIPQVTYVRNIDRFDGESLYAERELEDGIETVKVQLPALICVLKGTEEPTRPTIDGIKRAKNANITVYSIADIGLTPDEVGIKGSPTYVSKAFRPENKRGECVFCENAQCIADKIKEFGGING
jgi:electron transfer flavoprotein beta subunit